MLHRKKLDEQMYTDICEEFVSLGGVYVKFLQGILLRSKIMRKWQSPEKLRIFENLDSEPLDIVAVLRSELGPRKLGQIATVQPQTFAAGTFGQVYYAELQDKTPVIIKVLRPMIRETLKYDLKLLNTFMRRFYLKVTTKNMDTDSREALRDFAEATMKETDYKSEVAFATELYEAYKDSDTMFIPKTFAELCTDNIIVQEYVGGISLAHLTKLKQQGVDINDYVKQQIGSDLDTQLQTLGYELLRGAFDLPRIQGDPHPGNVRLLPGNRVGLIDFGISARAPEDKAAFFAMLQAYNGMLQGKATITDLFEKSLRFFVRDLYRSLVTISRYIGDSAEQALPKQIGKVAEKSFEQATGKTVLEISEGGDDMILIEANKIFNEGNRFGLIMKFEETSIIRASQSFNSLLITLGRFKQVMPKIMVRVVDHVTKTHPDLLHDSSTMPIGDAIDVVTNWLERVADKDPQLFSELSGKIRMKTSILKEGETHA